MRNVRKVITILFLIFIFNITPVSALSCADVEKQVDTYYNVSNELANTDCTKTDDSAIVNKCNSLNLQKNTALTQIFKANENKISCSNTKEKVKIIIKDNEKNCGKVFDDTIESMINGIMAIFYIVGPILLIFFGTLDFSQATISSDPMALKKASTKFFKRLLATLALFLSPLLTRAVLSFNTSGVDLSGNAYACNYNNIVAKSKYNIVYVPKSESAINSSYTSSSNGDSSTTINNSGDFMTWKQYNKPWESIPMGSDTVHKIGCLVTSVSIQAANSNTVKVSNFNPGVFVNTIKKHGGLTSGGAFTWTGWSSIAPNFQYAGQKTLTGSMNSKANVLKRYISQGYYPVIEVKQPSCGQHWIAVIGVEGNKILVADPASTDNTLSSSRYPCFNSGNNQVALFKVKK